MSKYRVPQSVYFVWSLASFPNASQPGECVRCWHLTLVSATDSMQAEMHARVHLENGEVQTVRVVDMSDHGQLSGFLTRSLLPGEREACIEAFERLAERLPKRLPRQPKGPVSVDSAGRWETTERLRAVKDSQGRITDFVKEKLVH